MALRDLAHMNPQDPAKPLVNSHTGVHLFLPLWSYLPLTRAPHKPLTCDIATLWCHQPVWAARPSTKRPWSLRERLDERDIANLITAYRDGATAASLATAHAVGASSVKRLLHTIGVHRASSTRGSEKTTPTATYP